MGSADEPANADEATVAQYIGRLSDDDPETKIEAIVFLGWGGHKNAVPTLGKLFADENRHVREMARWAVSEIGLYNVHAQHVVDWLGHGNREVKDAALACLLRYTHDTPLVRKVVRPLVKLLTDEDREVRVYAAIRLMDLDRGVMKSAFDQEGGELSAISGVLESGDLIGGSFALMVLAEQGSPDARQYCTNPSVTLRLACVDVALSRLGDAAVLDLLLLLSDEVTEVREIAAFALGRITSRESISGLERAARDECAGVRFRALIALGEIGGLPEATLRVIAGRLLDPEASVRKGAAIVLRMVGAAAGVVLPDVLAASSSNDVEVRRAVLITLAEIKPRSVDVLHQLLGIVHSSDEGTLQLIKEALSVVVPLAVDAPEAEQLGERILLLRNDPLVIAGEVTKILERKGKEKSAMLQ